MHTAVYDGEHIFTDNQQGAGTFSDSHPLFCYLSVITVRR